MIKINLALKKGSSLMNAPGGGGEAGGTAFTRLTQMDFKNIKVQDVFAIPKLKEVIILMFVAYGMSKGVSWYEEKEIEKGQTGVTELKTKETALRKSLEDVKKFDSVKQALEGDERIVRTKLETIEKLAQDRSGPPKVLLALSGVIPKEVWLSDMIVEGGDITVHGNAGDFQSVSDFMKGLSESVIFKDVELKKNELNKSNGRDLIVFDLTVKRR